MKKVLILGAGGICIDILDTLQEVNGILQEPLYECIGFLDDNKEIWGKEFFGIKVLGSLEKAKEFPDAYFVNGIGNSSNFSEKKSIQDMLGIRERQFLTVIHPSASVSKMATIGAGTVILQNVTVASNAQIGNHALIMPNSVISHDVKIGDYTFITAGVCVSGLVSIGTACYVGTNSSIIGKITIGDNSLIGMGSVVLDDVPAHSVYVGNPAKFLKKI